MSCWEDGEGGGSMETFSSEDDDDGTDEKIMCRWAWNVEALGGVKGKDEEMRESAAL